MKKYYSSKKKIKKICEYCKKVYSSCRSNQRFCSDKCKNMYHFPKTYYKKICLNCNESFTTTKSYQYYCTGKCYLIAKGIRAKKGEKNGT